MERVEWEGWLDNLAKVWNLRKVRVNNPLGNRGRVQRMYLLRSSSFTISAS